MENALNNDIQRIAWIGGWGLSWSDCLGGYMDVAFRLHLQILPDGRWELEEEYDADLCADSGKNTGTWALLEDGSLKLCDFDSIPDHDGRAKYPAGDRVITLTDGGRKVKGLNDPLHNEPCKLSPTTVGLVPKVRS